MDLDGWVFMVGGFEKFKGRKGWLNWNRGVFRCGSCFRWFGV